MSDTSTSTPREPGFRVVLLPGLDGSGMLFQPWLDAMPRHWPRQVIGYPQDRKMTYAELARWVVSRIEAESGEPGGKLPELVLVGESFGGPLSLMVASALGERVRAVVLAATFVRPPMWPWFCRLLAWPVQYGPRWRPALRAVMGDRHTSDELLSLAAKAIDSADPAVFANRVHEVAAVNAEAQLTRFPGRVMYLQARRDRIVRPGSLKRIQRLRPDVHAVRFDTPHLVTQHEPEATWAAVQAWLGG